MSRSEPANASAAAREGSNRCQWSASYAPDHRSPGALLVTLAREALMASRTDAYVDGVMGSKPSSARMRSRR
jgi:hypothetical protein